MSGLTSSECKFRKASFSPDAHGCVEVGLHAGLVRVRDSKDVDGAALAFTPREWEAFLKGVKAGEFDLD